MATLKNQRFYKTTLCCAAAMMILTACGGGGSGSASGSDTTAAQSASVQPEVASLADAAVNTAPAETSAPSAQTAVESASATADGPFGQDASAYTLTFNEEFNGNSLNTDIWMDHEWYDNNNSVKNYAVEDGSLKIWPAREADGSFKKRVINTDGKFYQTYGYFEVEAKLPIGKGTWPAFWLYNHDEADPFRPEIDIMEAYAGGGPASGWSDANLHPTAYAPTIWLGNPGDSGGTRMVENLGDLSAGFHKYAMKWEPNKQTFYFDGKEVYSANVSMQRRMYLLLDLLYGSASGQPDGSTPTGKTNSFEVKYVRAWQFK